MTSYADEIKLANYGNKEIGIVDPNLDLESYS